MKRKVLLNKLFLLPSLLLFFVACNKDSDYGIWDIYPTIIYVSVEDAQGQDLLDPQTEGNILENGIKAIYKGKTYEKDSIKNGLSRAYMPHFYGLKTDTLVSGHYILSIGEFAGDETFKNEEITIDWNDGSKDVIAFDSKLTWKKKEPSVNRVFYLNGKETKSPIVIVK